MSYANINVHNVVSIVVGQHKDRGYFEISFTDNDGGYVHITAFSATASAIPVKGATLTDAVPA